MSEWAEVLTRNGLKSAEEATELARRWEPSGHQDFPWPIRPDTGARDLRTAPTAKETR